MIHHKCIVMTPAQKLSLLLFSLVCLVDLNSAQDSDSFEGDGINTYDYIIVGAGMFCE